MSATTDASVKDLAAEYLSVPLLLAVEPIKGRDGVWRVRTSYPEFAGCETTSEMLTVAMDHLDDARVELTLRMVADGELPPRPRPPVPSLVPWIRDQLAARATLDTTGVQL